MEFMQQDLAVQDCERTVDLQDENSRMELYISTECAHGDIVHELLGSMQTKISGMRQANYRYIWLR